MGLGVIRKLSAHPVTTNQYPTYKPAWKGPEGSAMNHTQISVPIEGWRVTLIVDEDNHLNIYIRNIDGTEIIETQTDMTSDTTEWAERFTTPSIEKRVQLWKPNDLWNNAPVAYARKRYRRANSTPKRVPPWATAELGATVKTASVAEALCQRGPTVPQCGLSNQYVQVALTPRTELWPPFLRT